MTPLLFAITTFLVSLAAGMFGSLLGLGGGLIVIPVLTLGFDVDFKIAAGASIISVIATSSGAAAAYVRERMTNLRVAMFLELGTVIGAIAGAFVAGRVHSKYLSIVFSLIMAYSALAMLRRRQEHFVEDVDENSLASKLRLHDSYFDEQLKREVHYRVARPGLGLVLMFVAGTFSGLLGIGSGALKVPAMDLAMRLPIKVSTATSNFMIGVTAAASAGVYFSRGQINPFIAAPVAVGVMIGATAGSRLLPKLKSRALRIMFVLVLIAVSIQMFIEGVR